MTNRDLEIIDFVKKFKVAPTSTLCHFYFKSIHSCYKVLHRLFSEGYLNRMKLIENSQNSEYVYYIKNVPSQMKHRLALNDFVVKWDGKYGIQDFDVQKKLGDIIPDGIMISQGQTFLVEIELSNKGFDYFKYEKFYTTGEYKNYFDTMPTVIIYGKANIPTNTYVKYRVIGIS